MIYRENSEWGGGVAIGYFGLGKGKEMLPGTGRGEGCELTHNQGLK